jgi:hypothetical protein
MAKVHSARRANSDFPQIAYTRSGSMAPKKTALKASTIE